VTDPLRIYRRWFLAAAVYNVAWGLVVLAFPHPLLRLADIHDPHAAPLVGVIGMLVGVYGYGYYLLARNPLRYAPFIWIGLAGKTFGPVGFVWGALTGALPWRFGWVCLFNDVIWWPVFCHFALRHGVERRPSSQPS
jgi:hypothetical protein